MNMDKQIKILGFYRRDWDHGEYVHYEVNGKQWLTNGICSWDRIVEKVLPDLEKVEEIDINRILMKLKKHQKYHELIGILESSS